MRPDEVVSEAPGLAAFQRTLFAAITGQATGAAASDAPALIVSDARASAAERLHVYEHMYRARLVEALEAELPRLARRLGGDGFAELVAAYVAEHPSRHPSLRFLGQHLPAWLARRTDRDDAGVVADLARLEWARTDVFDERDEPVRTLESLRATDPEHFAALPLRLIAASRLIEVRAAALALWDAPEAEPASGENSSPQRVLVWRDGTAVYHRAVDDGEAAALRGVAAGTTFGAICDVLAEALPPEAAAARAFGWLSVWASDGLLVES